MSSKGTALMLMALKVHGFERVAEVDLGKLSHLAFLRRYIRPEAENVWPGSAGQGESMMAWSN